MSRTLIIAEAGVNHNGSNELALKLVFEAHKAGADIVKFQTFKAKNLVTESAEQARYQQKNLGKQESQLAMLQRLELSFEAHHVLINECRRLGIEFLSTAFDSESLHFLVSELGLKRLKIPSGELTNSPLLLQHAQTGCDLIVSTGMASLAEIEQALGVIAYGFLHSGQVNPSPDDFAKAYASREGQLLLQKKVVLLHCTTEYPAPDAEINLSAMNTMGEAFQLPVGYSDHSEGWVVPVAAVARGAQIIEKHFTLDRTLPGPDHKASLEPNELLRLILAIRQTEVILGDGVKKPTLSEIPNKSAARKSLVAASDIEQGEQFSEENLTVKRPGTGMSPGFYWSLLGKAAKQSYRAGELIHE